MINIHDEQVRNTIGKALGKIPSGVFILSAEHDGKSVAMMASWVQQVGFAPPLVSVAVAKGRPIGAIVKASGRLVLSVLSADDTPLMKKYARGIPEGADPFDGVGVGQTKGGARFLSESLAYLEGKVVQTIDAGGDHELVIAEVTDGHLLKEASSFVHLRGNGFHY